MAWYRIYIVSRDDQLPRDISVECGNDQEACVVAEGLLTPSTQAELWNGPKLVRVLSLSMAPE